MYYTNSSKESISVRNHCDDIEVVTGKENIEVNWDKNQSTCTIVSTDNSDWVQSVIVVRVRAQKRQSSRQRRHQVYGIIRKSNTKGSNINMRPRGRSRGARESAQLDKNNYNGSRLQLHPSVYASDTSISQSYDSSIQDYTFTSGERNDTTAAKGWKQKLKYFF